MAAQQPQVELGGIDCLVLGQYESYKQICTCFEEVVLPRFIQEFQKGGGDWVHEENQELKAKVQMIQQDLDCSRQDGERHQGDAEGKAKDLEKMELEKKQLEKCQLLALQQRQMKGRSIKQRG